MLTGHRLRLNRPIYYIAGPSGMVTAMTALLKCSGVNEDDMRTEEFVKSFRKNGGGDETRNRDLCRGRGPPNPRHTQNEQGTRAGVGNPRGDRAGAGRVFG